MDEHYRGKRIWIGAGALAIILLCVMVCGLGAMAMVAGRSGPVYGVQPPTGEGSAVPPQATYGHGPLGMGRYGGFGPFGIIFFGIGLLFKLLFFGLILLVLLGVARRLFWGHGPWGAHYWGRPPAGKEWKGRPHAPWGPWAWHCHGGPWEQEAEPSGEKDEPDAAGMAFREAE
jgi:hypothetical protein